MKGCQFICGKVLQENNCDSIMIVLMHLKINIYFRSLEFIFVYFIYDRYTLYMNTVNAVFRLKPYPQMEKNVFVASTCQIQSETAQSNSI